MLEKKKVSANREHGTSIYLCKDYRLGVHIVRQSERAILNNTEDNCVPKSAWQCFPNFGQILNCVFIE